MDGARTGGKRGRVEEKGTKVGKVDKVQRTGTGKRKAGNVVKGEKKSVRFDVVGWKVGRGCVRNKGLRIGMGGWGTHEERQQHIRSTNKKAHKKDSKRTIWEYKKTAEQRRDNKTKVKMGRDERRREKKRGKGMR